MHCTNSIDLALYCASFVGLTVHYSSLVDLNLSSITYIIITMYYAFCIRLTMHSYDLHWAQTASLNLQRVWIFPKLTLLVFTFLSLQYFTKLLFEAVKYLLSIFYCHRYSFPSFLLCKQTCWQHWLILLSESLYKPLLSYIWLKTIRGFCSV